MKAPANFRFGPYRLDIQRRRLTRDAVEVQITRSEYLLLRTLALNAGQTLSRRQLMQAVWGTAAMSHGALDALVLALRIKLGGEHPRLIAAATGNGYALQEDVAAPPAA